MPKRRFGSVVHDERRGTWHVQFRVDGRQRKRRVASEREAEKTLAIIEGLVLQRRNLEEILFEVFGERPKSMMTFVEAAGLYLQEAELKKRPSTLDRDISRLRVVCRSAWAKRDLAAITPAMIRDWANRRALEVSSATVNRYVSICRGVFKWAVHCDYLSDDPTRNLKKFPEHRRPRTLWLHAHECQELLRVAEPEFRSLVLCGLHAGLRRSELWALEWRSVSLDRDELLVEPEDAKSGKVRRVPLTSDLAEEFRAIKLRRSARQLRGRDRVFLRPDGRPWTESSTRSARDRMRSRAVKIDPSRRNRITMHVLRHTFASHLAQRGVPFQVIACLLGHSTTYVTERYAHMAPDSGRDAIPLLQDALRPADVIQESMSPLRTEERTPGHPEVDAALLRSQSQAHQEIGEGRP